MPRIRSLFISAVMIAAGAQIAMSPAAHAEATCVFRPALPGRVVVNQSVVGMRVPLVIHGPAACRDNVVASTYLVHGTHSEYLYWLDPQPYSDSIYASSVVPGTYRTTGEDCSAYDSDYNSLTCRMVPGSTVIKFAGRASLTAKRAGKRVTLTAKTARFEAYSGKAPTSTRVSVQRLSGRTWKTIKHATTRGSKGYSFTFTKRAKARYRVVAAENGVAFGATSGSVKK